jgi:hypothetical protein
MAAPSHRQDPETPLIQDLDHPRAERQDSEPCPCSCKMPRRADEAETPESTRDVTNASVHYDING